MPNDPSLTENPPMSNRVMNSIIFVIACLLAFDFYMSWPSTLITFLIMIWIGYNMVQDMRGQKGTFSLDTLATGMVMMVLCLIMIAGMTTMAWLGIK